METALLDVGVYFYSIFWESGWTKYSFEAMRLLLQLLSLPSYLVHQLTWDRFVNTHGSMGPCDLHNEHVVNKYLKMFIRHMGANFKQNALTVIAPSCQQYLLGLMSNVTLPRNPQHTMYDETSEPPTHEFLFQYFCIDISVFLCAFQYFFLDFVYYRDWWMNE